MVVTGVGSGKSTLAFDTIYAEGQRRYVESLSLCSSFLDQMSKPDVDAIEGLSPAIAIEQKQPPKTQDLLCDSDRSRDYLRLLYARVGRPAARGVANQSPTTAEQ